MYFRGVGVAKGNRPFAVCQNSWRDYLKGNGIILLESGRELVLPMGCFGVWPEDVNKHGRQGDSHVVSRLRGFPRQKPNFHKYRMAA